MTSGLITLPIPLVMGWFSDRIGRRPLLFICYLAGAAVLFGLAIATKLWQFWVASAVQSLVGASMGIRVWQNVGAIVYFQIRNPR